MKLFNFFKKKARKNLVCYTICLPAFLHLKIATDYKYTDGGYRSWVGNKAFFKFLATYKIYNDLPAPYNFKRIRFN